MSCGLPRIPCTARVSHINARHAPHCPSANKTNSGVVSSASGELRRANASVPPIAHRPGPIPTLDISVGKIAPNPCHNVALTALALCVSTGHVHHGVEKICRLRRFLAHIHLIGAGATHNEPGPARDPVHPMEIQWVGKVNHVRRKPNQACGANVQSIIARMGRYPQRLAVRSRTAGFYWERRRERGTHIHILHFQPLAASGNNGGHCCPLSRAQRNATRMGGAMHRQIRTNLLAQLKCRI